MDLNIASPAVFREDIMEGGSLRAWVEGSKVDEQDLDKIPTDELVKLAAFCHIIGMIDGNLNNLIINQQNGQVTPIDNGLSFPEMSKGFYNDSEVSQRAANMPIPDDLIAHIQSFFQPEKKTMLENELFGLLTPSEIEFMFIRISDLCNQKKIPSPHEK